MLGPKPEQNRRPVGVAAAAARLEKLLDYLPGASFVNNQPDVFQRLRQFRDRPRPRVKIHEARQVRGGQRVAVSRSRWR